MGDISSRVSVVIPTYGRAEMLKETVQSVLNQTYAELEIIVVDDNGLGTDGQKRTAKIMDSFLDNRVMYYPLETNSGGSYARNFGANISTGEYICFLDDDDTFLPTKVERQVMLLSTRAEYSACYCNHIRRFLETGREIEYVNNAHGEMLIPILKSEVDMCGGSSLMVRRNVFEALHGFDTSFKRYQDLEFVVRLSANGKIGLVETPLVVINTHRGSYSHKKFSKFEKDGTRYRSLAYTLIESYPKSIQDEVIFAINSNLLTNAIKLWSIPGTIKYLSKIIGSKRFGHYFVTKLRRLIKVE